MLRGAAPDRRPARGGSSAAPVHRRRAHRHGAGDRAQGRLPLALLRQGQAGAFVADASGGQRDRGRRALGGADRVDGRRLRDSPERYEGFDVPYTTACVGVIEGGVSDNIVPEDCSFHYEFRNLPGTDALQMQRRVLDAAARLEQPMKAIDPARAYASRTSARYRASWRAPTSPPCRRRSDWSASAHDAGGLRHRGRTVPSRRHLDRGVRPGFRRPGASARRVRQPRAARALRSLPAAAGRARRLLVDLGVRVGGFELVRRRASPAGRPRRRCRSGSAGSRRASRRDRAGAALGKASGTNCAPGAFRFSSMPRSVCTR